MTRPKPTLTLLSDHQTKGEIAKTWLLRIGVAVLFLFVGSSKFETHSTWVGIFDRIGLGQWFRYFTGTLQVLGAFLILIPRTFGIGILMLACTMAGAAVAWIFFLGEPINAMFPGILLGGLLAIGGEELIELFTRTKRQ